MKKQNHSNQKLEAVTFNTHFSKNMENMQGERLSKSHGRNGTDRPLLEAICQLAAEAGNHGSPGKPFPYQESKGIG